MLGELNKSEITRNYYTVPSMPTTKCANVVEANELARVLQDEKFYRIREYKGGHCTKKSFITYN